MAIRAGSGELKYRLPSHAEIGARQSAAAASAGGSASASAYSANRRYALGKRQLAHDALQSGLDRRFKAQQAFFDREHSKGAQLQAQQAKADLAAETLAEQQAFQSDQLLQNQAFQAEQALQGQLFNAEQAELDREFDERENLLRGIQAGELEIPEALRKQIRDLDSGFAEFDTLSPDQQQEFLEKREALVERALQSATPRVGPDPTPSQQFNRGVTYLDQQGRAYDEQNEEGTLIPYNLQTQRPVFEQSGTDPEVERFEMLNDEARKIMQEKTKEGFPRYGSWDEAFKEAQKRHKENDPRFAEPTEPQPRGAEPSRAQEGGVTDEGMQQGATAEVPQQTATAEVPQQEGVQDEEWLIENAPVAAKYLDTHYTDEGTLKEKYASDASDPGLETDAIRAMQLSGRIPEGVSDVREALRYVRGELTVPTEEELASVIEGAPGVKNRDDATKYLRATEMAVRGEDPSKITDPEIRRDVDLMRRVFDARGERPVVVKTAKEAERLAEMGASGIEIVDPDGNVRRIP